MEKLFKKNTVRLEKRQWSLRPLRVRESGFTLIELLIVIGVTAVLFGLISFNLGKAQKSSTLLSTTQTLVADIRSQQLKAMVGATETRETSDSYGIYFQNTTYTLFHGMVYIPQDTGNTVMTMDSTIHIMTTLPNNLLIFSKGSGEVAGWAVGQNTITLTNTTDNSHKIITLNKYGAITQIQ